jgi:hypothetical protein
MFVLTIAKARVLAFLDCTVDISLDDVLLAGLAALVPTVPDASGFITKKILTVTSSDTNDTLEKG